MQLTVTGEHAESAPPLAIVEHELQWTDASGVHAAPASASPPLEPLELPPSPPLLLPLLDAPLLLPELLLAPLLEPPLLCASPPPSSVVVTGGVLLEPLSHATAATMPPEATTTRPVIFQKAFDFITGPRSS
jgi:hypothetical protein